MFVTIVPTSLSVERTDNMRTFEGEDRRHKCCICGYKFLGYGNNPWPIVDDDKSRCCDKCNYSKVIPERIRILHRGNNGTEQSK